jgi:anti-anti-sigma factor
MATPLTLHTDRGSDGTPLLSAIGEIDISNIDAFDDALAAATTDAVDGRGTLTVDLSAVEYLDSAGINALSNYLDSVDQMRIIAHPFLVRVLTVSGLSEVATVDVAPASPGDG